LAVPVTVAVSLDDVAILPKHDSDALFSVDVKIDENVDVTVAVSCATKMRMRSPVTWVGIVTENPDPSEVEFCIVAALRIDGTMSHLLRLFRPEKAIPSQCTQSKLTWS
jgi:hypothetical protein